MCGVTFIFDRNRGLQALEDVSRAALARIAHRGPDDEGLWLQGCAAIGHRRLSIIDLQASTQPMSDPEGRYVLAFNGEIYNYQELRRDLQHSWSFRTQGDTETLLAGLILQGEHFLQKMEGMWAFAFWDTQEDSLLLCRDRLGKKPLYFQSVPQGIAVASELPALRVLNLAPMEEDLDSSADYLRYGYCLPGTTAFENVREVLPGHYLRWQAQGEVQQTAYWQIDTPRFAGTEQDAAEELRALLVQATKKRLVADVEVGAFLSGGVDSSLVVAITEKELGHPTKTFTIGFDEKSYDERVYARRIAEQYNTEHFDDCLTQWDSEQLTSLLESNVGQPFYDASLLPTARVSQLAASYVKVALSGDGGDELFSGYQRYQARSMLRWYSRLPLSLRHSFEWGIRTLPEPMAHHSDSLLKKAHLFLDIVARREDETPYVAPLLHSNAHFKLLAPTLAGKGHKGPALPEQCHYDDIQKMMLADALVYLPQDILAKVDRASMAYGLETRTPFLDHKLVEFAFSLPRHFHRRAGRGKRLLQKSFSDLLPNDIWNRRKQGFAVPLHDWFRGQLAGPLRDLLHATASPISEQYVKILMEEHQSGRRDHGYRLWNIYVYLTWRNRQLCLSS